VPNPFSVSAPWFSGVSDIVASDFRLEDL
jgi:hypothetical protein